jgi:hypothetical protein
MTPTGRRRRGRSSCEQLGAGLREADECTGAVQFEPALRDRDVGAVRSARGRPPGLT